MIFRLSSAMKRYLTLKSAVRVTTIQCDSLELTFGELDDPSKI